MDDNSRIFIVLGAEHAAMHLLTDTYNPLETFKEHQVFREASEKYLNARPYAGRPLFEMIKATMYEPLEDTKYVKTYQTTCYEHCLEVARKAVKEYYSEEDYKLYGEYLVACAKDVAESSGGGFLGMDAEYSDAEKQHIQRLRDMFELEY